MHTLGRSAARSYSHLLHARCIESTGCDAIEHLSTDHREMAQAQVQPCRYKTGKTLGAGSYSVVKECVHIDTGRYYAAKVINKRLMAGREHMVRNEIAVLKRVSMGHQNILTLVDYFETMNNCMPKVREGQSSFRLTW